MFLLKQYELTVRSVYSLMTCFQVQSDRNCCLQQHCSSLRPSTKQPQLLQRHENHGRAPCSFIMHTECMHYNIVSPRFIAGFCGCGRTHHHGKLVPWSYSRLAVYYEIYDVCLFYPYMFTIGPLILSVAPLSASDEVISLRY